MSARRWTAIAAAAALIGSLGAAPADAGPAPSRKKSVQPITWALASQAVIHPGVQTVTGNAQCTANFVFTDRKVVKKRNAQGKRIKRVKQRIYLGQAAHCGSAGDANETNGCQAPPVRPGTPVAVLGSDGSRTVGRLVYNAWWTMQARGEQDPVTCQYNDFALIKIPRSAMRRMNPSLPVYGGPTGLRTTALNPGERLLTYGNSSLRFEFSPASPKQCVALGGSAQVYNDFFFGDDEGWAHDHYCASPGVPGDSGSAFVDSRGRAVGVLSTLNTIPPGGNTATDMAKQLSYAIRFGGMKRMRLALGTEPFNPNVVAR